MLNARGRKCLNATNLDGTLARFGIIKNLRALRAMPRYSVLRPIVRGNGDNECNERSIAAMLQYRYTACPIRKSSVIQNLVSVECSIVIPGTRFARYASIKPLGEGGYCFGKWKKKTRKSRGE